MNSRSMILSVMREQGKTDARQLRERAPNMDGTALIAEEQKIPLFDPQKDYSGWPIGAPVLEEVGGEMQVFGLMQPHNAAHYPSSRPSNTPALWSIKHTKDPAKAKPWLAPSGTSGLYAKDEVCTDPAAENPTTVYRSKVDNNAYAPSAYPPNWEIIG